MKRQCRSTRRAIMATLREFVIWLSQQDGFRRRVKVADAEYFRLSLRDEAEALCPPCRRQVHAICGTKRFSLFYVSLAFEAAR
jgi:hypothetical protein